MSPTARLLKDAAADREREIQNKTRYIKAHSSIDELARFHRVMLILTNEVKRRVAGIGLAMRKETNAELFFVAEALRQVKRLSPKEGEEYLLGLFSIMHPSYPARPAIVAAYLNYPCPDLLDRVEIGQYAPPVRRH